MTSTAWWLLVYACKPSTGSAPYRCLWPISSYSARKQLAAVGDSLSRAMHVTYGG